MGAGLIEGGKFNKNPHLVEVSFSVYFSPAVSRKCEMEISGELYEMVKFT